MKPGLKLFLFVVGVIFPIGTAVYVYFSVYLSEFPTGDISEPISISAGDFNDADYFVKYGYAEIKDISKQMISLLTAMLIFSVTFSEKIINFSTASSYSKALLIISWVMMILALILDGLGLAFNALAFPTALADAWYIAHKPERSSMYFYGPVMQALSLIVLSGVCFVLSLVYLVSAGALSMTEKKKVQPPQFPWAGF